MTPDRELERLLVAERSALPDSNRQASGWRRLEASLSAGVPPLDVPLDGAASLWSPPAGAKGLTGTGATKQALAPVTKALAPVTKALAPVTKALAPLTKALAPLTKALAPLTKALAGLPFPAKMAGWFAAGAITTGSVMVVSHELGQSDVASQAPSSIHSPETARRAPHTPTTESAPQTPTTESAPPGTVLPPPRAVAGPHGAAATQTASQGPQRGTASPPNPRRAMAPAPGTLSEAVPHGEQRVAPAVAPSTAANAPEPFGRELELIRKAKVDFDAGRDAAARTALAEHAARFPNGVFAAERDGLSVLLECRSSTGEARRGAAAFLARYPDSPMAERIRHSCGLR